MFELYLISILDSIVVVCGFAAFFGVVALVVTIFCACFNKGLSEDSSYDRQQIATNNHAIKCSKPFLYAGIVGLILCVFVPTTKQGYVILGLGSTIEYLKNNETAKQLPNKAIIALDKFLDECAKEEQEEKEGK